MFPFSAIVGQEAAKLALAISAVDPGIGGVLLSGMKGTGKSTMVRAFAGILPKRKAAADCPFGCDPEDVRFLCSECSEAVASGDEPSLVERKPSIVTVPLGVTEDRLLGTINVEKLLQEGVQEFQPGLLARANNQMLYVDEVNLLSDNVTDDILDACAGGFNTVEREGVSVTHPARFILVGTMNPEEGNLRPQILDRFAMSVEILTEMNPLRRVEIIERNLAWESNPDRFSGAFAKADERLGRTIEEARIRLNGVRLPMASINTVAGAMSELQVDGQRPDLVTVRAARAWAALEDSKEVDMEALKAVAPLCVCHRTRSGGMNQPPGREELLESLEKNAPSGKNRDTGYFDPAKVLAEEA